MSGKLLYLAPFIFMSCFSCAVMVNEPEGYNSDQSHSEKPLYYTISTSRYFPFENNRNWWMFSEEGGNQLTVRVTDTISDDNIDYYRVSFQEHRVDTTDDWFKRVGGNILFGASLTGSYKQFVPEKVKFINHTSESADSSIQFIFHDSLIVKEKVFYEVLQMRFKIPFIHGFEEIWLANSVGIVMLKDYNGRWPLIYSLDSCRAEM